MTKILNVKRGKKNKKQDGRRTLEKIKKGGTRGRQVIREGVERSNALKNSRKENKRKQGADEK